VSFEIDFDRELALNAERIGAFIAADTYPDTVEPDLLRRAVRDYPTRGGKRLRSALLSWTCGLFGGSEETAKPAAAAVEIYHNWTLVHDDIIDDDDLRRGHPAAHVALGNALSASGIDASRKTAADFAVLAGDIQHGWAVATLARCIERGVSTKTTLGLLKRLQERVTIPLVSGEALDVHLSLRPLENVAVEEVERMMSLKTGALLEFCANAGAAIALDSAEAADSDPRAMETAAFAREAGIAFQLLDDWLGVFGDESTFGKPICSDLAESKPTVMLLDAVSALDGDDRTNLLSLLGRELDSAETARARTLFEKSGAPERTRREAEKLAESAKKRLDTFPDGKHKSLLIAWTNLLVNRKS